MKAPQWIRRAVFRERIGWLYLLRRDDPQAREQMACLAQRLESTEADRVARNGTGCVKRVRRLWRLWRARRTIDGLDRYYREAVAKIEQQPSGVDREGWLVLQSPEEMIVHVAPVGDLIWHEMPGAGGEECSCLPTVEPIPTADGRIGAVIIHRALDGRTQYE